MYGLEKMHTWTGENNEEWSLKGSGCEGEGPDTMVVVETAFHSLKHILQFLIPWEVNLSQELPRDKFIFPKIGQSWLKFWFQLNKENGAKICFIFIFFYFGGVITNGTFWPPKSNIKPDMQFSQTLHGYNVKIICYPKTRKLRQPMQKLFFT